MKLRPNKGFPYPVLSPYSDDYIESSIDVSVNAKIEGYDLSIDFEARVDDELLNELISNNQAMLVYHIECANTGFRTIIKTSDKTHRFVIPFKALRDLIEINSFIVAATDIENYQNDHFNLDYGESVFQISRGCILALAKEVDTRIPKKLTDLKEDDDPFVVIVPSKEEGLKTATVDLESDKIRIVVPETVSAKYKALQQTSELRPILISMFIVPALFQGLQRLHSLEGYELDDYSKYLWVQSLEEALKQGFDLSLESLKNKEMPELFELAQKMLESPLTEGIDNLMSYSGGANNED